MAEDDPTLREYLEQRINAERELREATQENMDTRLSSARREIDRRFETVEAQGSRIDRIEKFIENITGRTIAFGAIGAVFIAVSSAVLTKLILGGGG